MPTSLFVKKLITLVFSIICLTAQGIQAKGINKNAAPWVGDNFHSAPCQGKAQGFGPFDYLQRHRYLDQLKEVEGPHFTSKVEQLISGNRGYLTRDLDYTLRAWPNHHRALNSVIRYQLNKTSKSQAKLASPAECYLQRAINFSPKDVTARMLYAILLHRTKHTKLALTQYRAALEIQPHHAQTKYNLGLLLVERKEYTEANQLAQEVYLHGYPLPGLKSKLMTAGKWKILIQTDEPQESNSISEIQQQPDQKP